MSLKLVYVVPLLRLESTTSLGVRKKILSQAKAFRANGLEVSVVDASLHSDPYPHWVHHEYPFLVKALRLPFKRLYQFWHAARFKKRSFPVMIDKVRQMGDVVVYLRHAVLSPRVLQFKLQLAALPNVTCVYLEVPTWPYDREPYARSYERILRLAMRKIANRVVTFGNYQTIMGIPTIRITNGIDMGSTPVADPSGKPEQVKIAVAATLNSWVGLDRLLHGLARHMASREDVCVPQITVAIAGVGKYLERWQQLAVRLGLKSRVVFHGEVKGEALDRLFDGADLALGNLANHRRGLDENADLKSREYCARGIPFVISGRDDAFPRDFPFMLSLPSDNSPIDIDQLLAFHASVRNRFPDYQKRMREFAAENLDWGAVLKRVCVDMLARASKTTDTDRACA